MITAIEANILLNALVPNEKFYEASVMALESAATSGSLVVCDLVYAELCTYFPSRRECDAFLAGKTPAARCPRHSQPPQPRLHPPAGSQETGGSRRGQEARAWQNHARAQLQDRPNPL